MPRLTTSVPARPDGSRSRARLRAIAGPSVRLLGVTRDITERKKAERALTERNVQLALAGKTGLVGSLAYDTDTEMMGQISEGYAAIHGYPERTTEIARSECLATVHADDIAKVKLRRSEAFHEQRREYSVEYRIIRPSDELLMGRNALLHLV